MKLFLEVLITLPLFFIITLIFLPRSKTIFLKRLSLFYSTFIFSYSLKLLIIFSILKFKKNMIKTKMAISLIPNVNYNLGIDSISVFFIILISLLIPICILVNWESIKFKAKTFIIILFILEFLIFNIFCSLDIFFFFFFFESVLIPMFLIVGIWGSRQRKIHAAYQFFFYTFFGSIFMLISFLIIFIHVGSSNINIISLVNFSENRQTLLWLGLFLSFAIKIPILPFHIWLPEAHVEAPTSGSILLAGILLKLGTYGFLRFLLPLFPYSNKFFTPFILVLCSLSILYGSLNTIRQIDLKKIIAYSSVVHMNFAIIGLFSNNIEGLEGSFFLMLSHGIISSSLFFCIGILYDRYHTRILYYYGGIIQIMPIFGIIFLIFSLSNMGFPGTSGFIGEILIFISIFFLNTKIALLILLSMIFSAIYSVWLYNRLLFGEIKFYNNCMFKWLSRFSDFSKREFFLLIPFIFLNFILGFYPSIILNISYLSLLSLIN